MEAFVTLVDGCRPQLKYHKDLHLKCCDGFRYVPVKELLKLIKNIKMYLLLFLLSEYIV